MSGKDEMDSAEVVAAIQKAFEDMGRQLVAGLETFKMQLDGGTALNWMLQGRLAAARESLADLSPDQLRALSLGTFGVSQLCDELLAEKGIDP